MTHRWLMVPCALLLALALGGCNVLCGDSIWHRSKSCAEPTEPR